MTTLRDLLHDAAASIPPPAHGLEEAVRRGRRSRRQAVLVRATALPVAIVIVLIGVTTLGASDPRPQRVDTVDNPADPADPTTESQAQSGRSAPNLGHTVGTTPSPTPTLPDGTSLLPPRGGPTTTTTTFVPAPSGPRVAFWSDNKLFTVRVDGGDRRLLASPGLKPFAWSPDRRTLLVSEANGSALDALDVETGVRRRIAEVSDGTIESADISPDGTRIVYWVSDDDTVHVDSRPWDHIWVANNDGSGAHELSVHGQQPSWSPDGARILMSVCTTTNRLLHDICTVRADGSEVTGVDVPMSAWPRLSPDGAWIAGVYVDRDTVVHLVVARPDGSEARDVSVHARNGRFAWTTDSRHVVYEGSYGCESGHCPKQGLFRVAVDGTGEVQLTDDGSSPVIPWR